MTALQKGKLNPDLKNFLVIKSFLPEDFSAIFIWCSLNSSTSSCLLHIRLPSFYISMKSLEIQPLIVKKDLTVCQSFLLAIIPSFVASLKKYIFAFLVKELHLFLVLLYEVKFFLDVQFKFLLFTLDLFIIALLRSVVIKVMKEAWFCLTCFCFSGVWWLNISLKISVSFL